MKNFVKHIINFFKYILLGSTIGVMALCSTVALLLVVSLLLSFWTAPSSDSIAIFALSVVSLIGATAWYDITDSLRKALWR